MASASTTINQNAQQMANPFRNANPFQTGDFGVSQIQNRINQESASLGQGYDWTKDEGAQAFRADLGREQNILRNKMRDTLQGGASPMAIARETAKWDAQTRRDVLGYIAGRKQQAQQSVDTLFGQLSNAQSNLANYQLRQREQALAEQKYQEALRQQQIAEQRQRESDNPFSFKNIGKGILSVATGGLSSLIDSVISDRNSPPNTDYGSVGDWASGRYPW